MMKETGESFNGTIQSDRKYPLNQSSAGSALMSLICCLNRMFILGQRW